MNTDAAMSQLRPFQLLSQYFSVLFSFLEDIMMLPEVYTILMAVAHTPKGVALRRSAFISTLITIALFRD